MGEIVSAGDLVGDDHAPCVDDELTGFSRVQSGKIRVHPVETLVRCGGHLELERITTDQRRVERCA